MGGENFAFFIFCTFSTGSGETPGELGGARVDGGSGSRWAEITLTLRESECDWGVPSLTKLILTPIINCFPHFPPFRAQIWLA